MKSAIAGCALLLCCRRLGGACVRAQLSTLPDKKGSHRRRAERKYFVEYRRELWLLD